MILMAPSEQNDLRPYMEIYSCDHLVIMISEGILPNYDLYQYKRQ